MFAAVDRVVETGHDPRRFAEDLLERLRDLIVLDAVPDAAGTASSQRRPTSSSGCAAGRPLRPGQLSRAADVVNAGLTEMRGAAAPRLLLELVCARVLLPGVDDDARGVHARLDRIERRLDVTPAAAATRPEPPPRRAPSTRCRPAAAPAPPAERRPGRGPGAGRAAAGGAGRRRRAVDRPHRTGARPRPPARPADRRRAAATRRRRRRRPVSTCSAVRQMWPEVVERVKEYKRVTWMLLMEQVQVASVDDRVLVLAFGNAGKRRGFSASGHDEIVRQALIDVLGPRPAGRRRARSHRGRVDAAAGRRGRQGARAARRAVAAPTAVADAPPAAANGRRRRRPPEPSQARPAAPTVRPEDDVGGRRRRRRARTPGSAGADLVARELGGSVIGEFGPA